MNAEARSPSVAVVCDPGGDDAASMRAFLQTRDATDAHWYAPRELHHLDRAVRAGGLRGVICARPSDLLEGLWDEQIALERWLAAGVQIEFVEPTEAGAAVQLEVVWRSWQRWRRAHRRQQVCAGALLSIVALAAAFALSWTAAHIV